MIAGWDAAALEPPFTSEMPISGQSLCLASDLGLAARIASSLVIVACLVSSFSSYSEVRRSSANNVEGYNTSLLSPSSAVVLAFLFFWIIFLGCLALVSAINSSFSSRIDTSALGIGVLYWLLNSTRPSR